MLDQMEYYERLLMRIQAAANNFEGRKKRQDVNGKRSNTHLDDDYWSASIIEFKLYFKGGALIGWSKPLRTPLEPRPFDMTIFELEPISNGWNGVFLDLVRESKRGCNPVEKMLVVRENGEPAGWFADRVKVGV